MDSQVSRETWESKVIGVSLVCQAHEEKTVLRVPKAEPGPMESQAP